MTDQPAYKCDLCGLRVPSNPPSETWNSIEHKFCCTGCRKVFLILAEGGMLEGDFKSSAIYKASVRTGVIPDNTVAEPKKEVVEIEKFDPGNVKELTLHVGGMWCSACSWLINKVVDSEDGVIETDVLFTTDTAKIKYIPQKISAEKIREKIESIGYKVADPAEMEAEANKERNNLLLRMGVAIFIAINIMMLNSVLYVDYFQNVSEHITKLISAILWLFATPSVFWCGYRIHYKAYTSMRSRAPTMEVLLSIGILTSYFYSIYMFFQGSTHIYFDTSANLVALVLLGKFFETSARQKATTGIHRLYRMFPGKVRLKTSEGERMVTIDQLAVNDHFIVKEGEKIASDGIIIKGNTSVDESLLTGESKPVKKGKGDNVVGSSMNIGGYIEVRTTHTGEETTLSKIVKMVENALAGKSKIQEIVDRVSRVFIPFVILTSILTISAMVISGHPFEGSIMRGLTVLVIACPCALGIATPLAMVAGIGYSAKNGILIKSGIVFQKASRLSSVFFDKTGTITTGTFSVIDHISTKEGQKDETEKYLGSLESASNHPIGKAITKHTLRGETPPFSINNITNTQGLGISGSVNRENVVIGNLKMMELSGVLIPDRFLDKSREMEELGHTVVFYSISRKDTMGMVVLGDKLKETSKLCISKIKKMGIDVKLISGDSAVTTKAIASKAGISDFYSELSPEGKIEMIKGEQKGDKLIAMVGDGINDAPSLAQADLGIAIGSGTEIAIESSEVVLLSNSIVKAAQSIEISKRTIRTIKQNLTWAFLYNTIGIFIAVSGYLNPLIAASAMLLSSISVVFNSLRLSSGPGETSKKLKEIFLPWVNSEE
ncbi:MAG: heavy metal translocating P-type ATPase [Acidobacteriota bacterium]